MIARIIQLDEIDSTNEWLRKNARRFVVDGRSG